MQHANIREGIIRSASPADAPTLLEIYSPHVEESAASFEITTPSLQAFKDRIVETIQTYPWLVLETNNAVIGYAYANQHRARPAYAWSVEVSVYVSTEAQRLGAASLLYNELLKCLTKQGFANALAVITLPNEGSVRFHQSRGFTHVGVYKDIGFKLGRWWDVGYWQRALQHRQVASPLTPFIQIREQLADYLESE